MTNEEKRQMLEDWLVENGYAIEREHYSKRCEVMIPVMVRQPRIAIHVGSDDEFFQKVKTYYKPFFIREEETMDFILEKMRNCIDGVVMKRPLKKRKIKVEEKPKRKRMRIPKYEKVQKRGES